MIPTTSIDGTDITGATIDGQDVQEITVDGDTVFTAEALPVAYSNLVAWYPFDSSFYGGSNADDVTALFNSGQSGDSTAYDGTVNGATYKSSGGVTDINAGTNSGGYDFDGSGDHIDIGKPSIDTTNNIFSIATWFKTSDTGFRRMVSNYDGGQALYGLEWDVDGTGKLSFSLRDSGGSMNRVTSSSTLNDGSYHHVVGAIDGSTVELMIDGDSKDTTSMTIGSTDSGSDGYIGASPHLSNPFQGELDDVRYYDKAISESEANDIFTNTK